MQKYTIKKTEEGQRLDKFISKKYKKITKVLMYKLIRKNCIKVNKKKVKFDYVLKENDEIYLFINDELLETKKVSLDFLECEFTPNICYDDENIMIVIKDRQIKVHDGLNSLLNSCLKYMYLKGEFKVDGDDYFTPAFSNRLDTNTAGLLILGKNPIAIKDMNSIIKNGDVKKIYTAICNGNVNVENKIYSSFIYKVSENHFKVTNKENNNSKNIITKINTIKNYNKFSLLEITLITGRTHQIRAHLEFLGNKILGDNKYGDFDNNKFFNVFTQCLSATKLVFSFNENNKYMVLDYLNGKTFSFDDSFIYNTIERIKKI